MLFRSLAEVDDGSCEYAGTGGNTAIIAKPQHHGVPVLSKVGYNDSALVKFNTQDFPGDNPGVYDLIVAGIAGDDNVQIQNLKPGKYYIFMTGFDSTINKRVSGGIPYILIHSSGQDTIVVPVTEQ